MSLPLRVPFHISGRAKPYSQLYFGLCAKALLEYRALDAKLQAIDHMKPEYESVYSLAHEASIKPIVFGAMCIEATLYDLSAAIYGEAYANEIDRVPPPQRFRRLATKIDSVEPNERLPVCTALQHLFAARKKLVHYKSKSMLSQDWTDLLNEYREDHRLHFLGIESSLRAPILLSIHFDGNIFEELRILPSFKLPEYWESAIPPALHEDVLRCIADSAAPK